MSSPRSRRWYQPGGGRARTPLAAAPLLPLAGSFDVRLNDGTREEVLTLNRPNIGLHIGPMTWRELENFSSGSVCMVLASTPYDEADYIRDFDAFLARARG